MSSATQNAIENNSKFEYDSMKEIRAIPRFIAKEYVPLNRGNIKEYNIINSLFFYNFYERFYVIILKT